MSRTIRVNSAEEMEKLGGKLAESAKSTEFLWLTGPLGAGKTTFAKGFFWALGACETITSPSFLIAKEHEGARIRSVHIDLFRIDSYEKFRELGLEEYFSGEWFVACEWADRLSFEKQDFGIHLQFSNCAGGAGRIVSARNLSGKPSNPIFDKFSELADE